MKSLTGMFVLVLLLLMSALLEGPFSDADAAVLCVQNNGGVTVRRIQCNSNEDQLDPAALGLVGPQGPQGPPGPQGSPGPQGVYTHNTCTNTFNVRVRIRTLSSSAVGEHAPGIRS